MATAIRSTIFRVTGLPFDKAENEIQSILAKTIHNLLTEDEKKRPTAEITCIPSCDGNQTSSALVEFKGANPEFLSQLAYNPLGDWQVEMGDEDINFDRHFLGFTQLYPTAPSQPITADIIAITGLDGHAYGSWRGKGKLGRMWLRSFLSKDLPSCRTMIYGYNSKLSSHGIDTIMDYGREFLEGIKRVRYKQELRERPLFFIAHSFGGIILAHCLVKAVQTDERDHATIAALHRATYGILFFGTPHKGLVIDDIQRMVAGEDYHPRTELLEQIKLKSDLLMYQLADFKNLIRDRKIISFYETQQTRRLELNRETGSWSRTGTHMTAVDSDSAILQLPDSIETKIPVNADHSQIIKFDSRNAEGYKAALGYLKQFEQDAGKVISDRFCNSSTPYAFARPSPTNIMPSESGVEPEESWRHRYYLEYACRLQQNLPPQVLLSHPVVLYDALEKLFVFQLEWMSSAEFFLTIMERSTHNNLEEKYKDRGSAKIRNGEFLLQDLETKRKFNLLEQPWSYIMKPGKKRYMSIKFRETGVAQQSCPHCGSNNETVDGQPTTCQRCGATYERIVEIEDQLDVLKGDDPQTTASREDKKEAPVPTSEPDLRLAFRRLTITSNGRRKTERQRPPHYRFRPQALLLSPTSKVAAKYKNKDGPKFITVPKAVNNETANETETSDAFDTAYELDTETEGFQTGVEDMSGSDEISETEAGLIDTVRQKPPPLALSKAANRQSFQSSASTSSDEYSYEEVRTPTAQQPQRLRLRVSRGENRRLRAMGEEPQFQSSPVNFANSRNSTPQAAGQSLFAELGDISNDDEELQFQSSPANFASSSRNSTPQATGQSLFAELGDMSDEDEELQFQSSPVNFANSRNSTPQAAGQSLFAELGDISNDDEELQFQSSPANFASSSRNSTPQAIGQSLFAELGDMSDEDEELRF